MMLLQSRCVRSTSDQMHVMHAQSPQNVTVKASSDLPQTLPRTQAFASQRQNPSDLLRASNSLNNQIARSGII